MGYLPQACVAIAASLSCALLAGAGDALGADSPTEDRPAALAEAAHAYAAGRLSDALVLAEKASRAAPADTVAGASARLLRTWAAVEAKNTDAVRASGADLGKAPPPLRTRLPAHLLFAEAHGRAAAGDTAGARKRFEELLDGHPTSPAAIRGRWWLARNDPATALMHLDRLLTAKPRWLDPADVLWAKARTLRDRGKKTAAIVTALDLVVHHPESAAAADASRLLDALAGADWRSKRLTPELRARRLKAMIAARLWREACPEAETRWSAGPGPGVDLKLGELHAKCLSKFKRFKEAGELYEELSARAHRRGAAGSTADFLFKAAGAHAGRHKLEENPDRAVEIYDDFATRYPGDKRTPEAAFMAAYITFTVGKSKEALTRLDAFLAAYPKSKLRWSAVWYAGWIRYLDGDCAGALPHFTSLGHSGGVLRGDKGLYWRARCLEKTGKKSDAVTVWRKLSEDHPFDYYGLLSRRRLTERGEADHPFGLTRAPPPPAGRPPAHDPVGDAAFRYALLGLRDTTTTAALPAGATTPAARLGLALLGAGLRPQAAAELRAARSAIAKAAGKGGTRASLLLLRAAGDHATTRRAGAALPGVRSAPKGSAAVDWELAFPMAFAKEVRAAAARHGVPEELLFAVMHKESGFDPRAVSYADALGLMQILPKTGRRIAARRDLSFAEEMLFEPMTNVDFAGWYLAELQKKFAGQFILAVPAYNGGPNAVARWLDATGTRPFDEFVETITYLQSREYTKKVSGLYARYRYLYGSAAWLPPATVDPKYGDNIDF